MLIAARIAAMLLLTCSPNSEPQTLSPTPSATGFLCKTTVVDGQTYAYSVFIPPEYDPNRPWPAILFLHGSGERGADGLLQTEVGIGRALRRNHKLIPAIVVMPQCRENEMWVGPMGQMALRCLEQTSRAYRLDPERIYLTGLSLGGQGVWHIAAEFPDRFAAVVPICGFAEWKESTGVAQKLAPRLTKVPIWCFHGALDKAVPVEKGRELVNAIRAAGGDIQYTEYPDGDHQIWDRVYEDARLWKWLFAQRLGATAPPAP
jgi:predicted peptidase